MVIRKWLFVTVMSSIYVGWAATEVVDGITWRYSTDGYTACVGGGYYGIQAVPTSTIGDITIPSVLGGKRVTRIGLYAFQGCSGLTSVTIPTSVTSIMNYAFRNCSGLTSLTIPFSVAYIGEDVFVGCGGLTSFVVGDANRSYKSESGLLLTKDGKTLMAGVNGDVTIPSSVKVVCKNAFCGCNGLTSVVIPSSVTNIGESAFANCSALMSFVVANANKNYTSVDGFLLNQNGRTLISGVNGDVAIPSCVTRIRSNAFYGCGGLTSVSIPSSVTSIGDFAFRFCSGLTSASIPSSVTSVGMYAFANCSGLTSATIPSSVTSISDGMFFNCSGLTSISIPSSVTSIGCSAFGMCSGLSSVMIPWNVKNISYGAFFGCSGLTEFTVHKSNSSYKSENGLLLTKDGKTLVAGVNGDVTIPSSVTSIGDYAFQHYNGLTSVAITTSVENVGEKAFDGCNNLGSVTVPGWKCGIDFSSVTNLVISEGVTSVSDSAFSGCKGIKSVTIPEGVTSIGEYAFRNCSGLTSVTIPEGVTSIGKSVFSDCLGLTSVTIPSSVTSIGSYAFYGCSALTLMAIPSEVTDIGEYAFSDCSGLTSVMIPSSVISIGRVAFGGCSKLPMVTIPSNMTSIGSSAFSGCSILDAIDFECPPPAGIKNAAINVSAAIRYNVMYKTEWMSVIDECGWTNVTPYKPGEGFPDLGNNPTQEEIQEALDGSKDNKIKTCITNAANYNAYRVWANKIGSATVKSSANAWLSYAFGNDRLLSDAPTSDDLTVEEFSPTGENGKFDFVVLIDGVNVGGGIDSWGYVQKENLKQVFGLEGASTLDPNSLSSANVDITFGTPENGKVKFTAGPNAKNADAKTFFMKVKMTP